MHTFRSILFIQLVVLLAVAGLRESYAQVRLTLDPAKAVTQYRHRVWTSADGLPQNSVDVIEQTRDGYLWAGTQEGLVRFDGQRFTVFDRKTVDAFAVNSVQELAEAPDGTLWIGLRGGGLVAYSKGRFTAYTTAEGLSSAYVTDLHVDEDGAVWVGTFEGGVSRLRDGVFTVFGANEGLPGRVVSVLYRDPQGTLWAGTDAGLFSFDGRAFAPAPEAALADAYPTAYFVDRRGHRWVGTRDGRLWEIREGTVIDHSAQVANPENYLKTILEDVEGTIWLGIRGGGLLRYHDGRFSTFGQAQGLSHDAVLSLEEDREGGLWIGTKNGLDQLQDGKFTTYTTQEGLSDDKVMSVHEDAAGALWVATEGGGVSRLQDGRFTTHTTADGLASDDVLTVNSDPSGAVWIGTLGSGLNRLRDGRLDHFTTADGLAGNEIYVLYTDSRGRLWVGTEGGVSRYDGASFANVTTEEGLTSPFVSALLEGRDGSLWIGTYDGGLNRLHDGAVTAYTTADGLASDAILALHEDADGVLWIGTYGEGLSRLHDGHFTTFTSRDGLFDDTAAAILEDDAGHLWITCNKGIFRVSKHELNAFAHGQRDRIASTVFGVADGLKTAEANGGQQPAAWKDRQGRLWFPMTKGVAMIDPAHLRTNGVEPPVVVEQVIVDRVPVDLAAAISLPPGSDKLEFQYVALSLAAPERVRYEVMLEGHDEAWVDMDGRREAFYTNLDPGSYTFRVRAANNDGLWNEAGAAVTFYLKPFFYQTAWFWGLCAFGVLLLAFSGYRVRIRQLKARERELERTVDERTRDLRLEKERTEQAKDVIEAQAEKLKELDRFKTRFFANVSHEFRTPLTMIVGPLENALSGAYGALGGPVQRQLEIMLRNALRLMRLINQLLDLQKLEAGKMTLRAHPRNLVSFVEGVVLTCSALAEQKKIDLRFEAEAPEMELYYEPDKLEKVFYNLLSNALKYTPSGGHIVTTLSTVPPRAGMPDGAVRVVVTDTGKGIPAKELPFIFDRFRQVDGSNTREHEGTGIGLALVKELVLLHYGTIEAESEAGVGTTFTVLLPLGTAHLQTEEIATQALDDDDAHPEHGAMMELSIDLSVGGDGVPASTAETPAAPPPGDAPLVLIVDDNADVREYVGTILGEAYRIASASDGVEGLEQARALEPDLIVSDVMMPRMDGNELCRHIKSDADLSHVPVILLTARATHELKMEGLEVGADDYMSKPFNARELKARVKNLIQLYQQEKALRQLNDHLEDKVRQQLDVMLEERSQYEAQLFTAKERAEASERLKSAILDNISHEFRTPLSVILGYAEIIAADAPEDFQDFATDIEYSSKRLLRALDALLTLSDLEARTKGVRLEPLPLAEVARAAVARYEPSAALKGVALRLDAPADDPCIAEVDAEALRCVLENLLDNALKFTHEGEVRVTVGGDGAAVHVRVRDTGVGIGSDFIPHLFEAFTQESSGTTRSFEGTGLGLTIAHRLAELMDGTITVASEQGAGSVFTVSFSRPPASRPDHPPAARQVRLPDARA